MATRGQSRMPWSSRRAAGTNGRDPDALLPPAEGNRGGSARLPDEYLAGATFCGRRGVGTAKALLSSVKLRRGGNPGWRGSRLLGVGGTPRGSPLPFIPAAEIKRLRTMEKVVDRDWQAELLSHLAPLRQHRIELLNLDSGPTRGAFHVYARQGATDDDFSTGLVVFLLGGERVNLLRCNGPHPNQHFNAYPCRRRLPVSPHVHYLTERYQREHAMRGRTEPDGFALATTAYGNVAGAMAALARRANIVPRRPPLPSSPMTRLP